MIELLLTAGLVGLAIALSSLQTRVRALTGALAALGDRADANGPIKVELARLHQRVSVLERQASEAPGAAPAPAVEAPPVIASSIPTTTPASLPIAASASAPAALRAPAPLFRTVPDPGPLSPASHPASDATRTTNPSTTAPASTTSGWEVTVGGNWLNKLGVLVFVSGIALLVGYSMAHVGPLGRVAIGYALSLVMLGTGVRLERRAPYRLYAHGLVAGGWAGLYFTTYALHALDAARLVDSDVVAAALLASVAAGMIAHSLKYRAEAITGLTYVVGYATLALTPLTSFAVFGAIPLAASALLVSRKFGWTRVSLLTIVSTYATFTLRRAVIGPIDATVISPIVALVLYWILFEASDIAVLAGATGRTAAATALFPVNAAGLIGAGLVERSLSSPEQLSAFLATASACYLVSALIRGRVLRDTNVAATPAAALGGGYQGAVVVSAAMLAWAIVVRFDGPRQVLALLALTELILFSALALKDRILRALALSMAAFSSLNAMALIQPHRADTYLVWGHPIDQWAFVTAAAAAAWYLNAEITRRRAADGLLPERGYSFVASWFVIVTVVTQGTGAYCGMFLLMAAVVLFERGLRAVPDYRWQAYVTGWIGAGLVLVRYVAAAAVLEPRHVWTALTIGAALTLLIAVRAWRARGNRLSLLEARIAAVAAGAVSLTIVAVLEWRVLAPAVVALMWALTALSVMAVARWRRLAGLNWLAFPLLLIAAARVSPLDLVTPRTSVSSLMVIASLFAAGLVIRRPRTGETAAGWADEIDDVLRATASILGSLLLMNYLRDQLERAWLTSAWALEGAALLAFGFPLRERVMRLSGLALLFVCILKIFVYDLATLEPLARIFSFVALGLVLLAVSWIYTRFREQIQKYL